MDEYAGIDAERLIPAYAGSTRRRGSSGLTAEAHPRLRGEHGVTDPHLRLQVGSSPLTRGARFSTKSSRGWGGLIPAYAGSTA